MAIIEVKKRGDPMRSSASGFAASNVKSRRRSRSPTAAGRRPGAGAARFDPDHHQRQGPPVGLCASCTGRDDSSVWTSLHDGDPRRGTQLRTGWSTIWSRTSVQSRRDRSRCSLNDLGVGSRDAVVLSGELSELLGRPVSPVDFWQYPTINALVEFLTGGEDRTGRRPVATAATGDRSTSRSP